MPDAGNGPTRVNRSLAITFLLQGEGGCEVFFLSYRHFMLLAKVSRKITEQGYSSLCNKESAMDDYQEELLEFQAFELDPLEPAEDATEL